MSLVKEKKAEIIDNFKIHTKDTGSAVVQIALLTEQINHLTDHFKVHRKDFHSRRGLLKLVANRRSLMRYMEKHDKKTYDSLMKKLNLKK